MRWWPRPCRASIRSTRSRSFRAASARSAYTMQRPTEDRFLLARQIRKPHRRADGRARRGSADLRRRGLDRRLRRPGACYEIAMEMVTRYGMNETVGQRTYAPPPPPFLAGTSSSRVDASEATEREIDVAVRDLVAKAFDRATDSSCVLAVLISTKAPACCSRRRR